MPHDNDIAREQCERDRDNWLTEPVEEDDDRLSCPGDYDELLEE